MEKTRKLTKGRNLDRWVLQSEADSRVRELEKLRAAAGGGKKPPGGGDFEEDLSKLEAAIERTQDSKISDSDKKAIIAQLDIAIEAVKEQYDRDITKEEERVQQELLELTESMQEAADESEHLAHELRSVEMVASDTDASAAADEADAQKEAFEQIKSEYVDKLNLQIEQAAIQRRNIQNGRLRGR